MQDRSLVLGFDALGDDLHVQAVAQGNDRFQQLAACWPDIQLLDEGPVDLEAIEFELLQIAQRGIARAEIVEQDLDAHFAQALHGALGFARMRNQDTFGNLDVQQAGRDAMALKRGFHAAGKAIDPELDRRHVNRNRDGFLALDFQHGLVERPRAQLGNEAALFRNRDKHTR